MAMRSELKIGALGFLKYTGMARIVSVSADGRSLEVVRPNGDRIFAAIDQFTASKIASQERAEKEWDRKVDRAKRFAMNPKEIFPGQRICSTNREVKGVIPGILATIDRALDNGNFIVITDSGQTCCVARNEFFLLSKPKITTRDFQLLREMRISL